jgi:hypothetical protein
MTITRCARLLNLAASWLLAIVVALAVVDIATSEPCRWHLIPGFAQPLLTFAPLLVAVLSLAFTSAASLKGEVGATRLKQWLTSALIALLYVFVFVWNLIFPMRVD